MLHTRTIIYGVVCAGALMPATNGSGVRTIAYLYCAVLVCARECAYACVKVRDKLRLFVEESEKKRPMGARSCRQPRVI